MHGTHLFPQERTELTRKLTADFMDEYEGGIFTGWRTTRDYNLANPVNPESLLGDRVGALFEDPGTGETKEYFGEIWKYTKSRKWWQVRWLDGDEAEYNYWELSRMSSPPNFEALRYEDPATVTTNFLVESKGARSLVKNGTTFELRGEMYVFISVIFVSAADPFVGGYIQASNFEDQLRELSYDELQANTRVHMSPMPLIKQWLKASAKLQIDEYVT